ncbi:hypothetical protein CONLIGDRAFT_278429 [Coniochaeta ligniaria NRRL 30616]|uniref:Uncharacterized protein n=1 Tax=Coniochaeta ligniaria NRRL 30616 TaxID=1408157 RepID=A0A1J7I441_9PEZI|nr:hypothetical protein CONLIGDRAFT_278429 [Coniochaeta ligniaria NRRL 30616]
MTLSMELMTLSMKLMTLPINANDQILLSGRQVYAWKALPQRPDLHRQPYPLAVEHLQQKQWYTRKMDILDDGDTWYGMMTQIYSQMDFDIRWYLAAPRSENSLPATAESIRSILGPAVMNHKRHRRHHHDHDLDGGRDRDRDTLEAVATETAGRSDLLHPSDLKTRQQHSHITMQLPYCRGLIQRAIAT